MTAQNLIISLVLTSVSLFLANPVLAANSQPNSPTTIPSDNTLSQQAVQDTNQDCTNGCPLTTKNFKGPQNTQSTLDNLVNSGLCDLDFPAPLGDCVSYQLSSNTNEQGELIFSKAKAYLFKTPPEGGPLGLVSNAMIAMYTHPPTSTAQYLADLSEGFGVKRAYAQSVSGSGANIIQPVKSLWQFTSNVAYLAFIIVFVVIGFMIMFRVRINPQTVISIQSALPGLVIGIILVYFSYFIAALITDLSFLGVQLGAQVFIQSKQPNIYNSKLNSELFGSIQDTARDSSAYSLFRGSVENIQSFQTLWKGIWDFTSDFSPDKFIPDVGSSGTIINKVISKVISGIRMGVQILYLPFRGLLTAGGTLIVVLILAIVIIIQFLRLFIKLVKAYISILVMTIAGPLFILYASVPGRGGALSVWWKSLLANSLIFPAVFVAFLFGGMVLAVPWPNTAPPLFGQISTTLLQAILGYAIILGTPAIPDMVKKAFGVGDMGDAIATAAIAGVIAARTPYQLATARPRQAREYYLKDQAAAAALKLKLAAPATRIFGVPVPNWNWVVRNVPI